MEFCARKMLKHFVKAWILAIMLYRTLLHVEGQKSRLSVGISESNILTMRDRDSFTFTVYPPPLRGHGKNVADERQWLFPTNVATYGVEAKSDSESIAYISVDLKRPYYVRAFAVTGYAGGLHSPLDDFFLEGSMDGSSWKMVAIANSDKWHSPGTYPFLSSQIVQAMYPGRYQFYRVIAKWWRKGSMIMYNWGLFT